MVHKFHLGDTVKFIEEVAITDEAEEISPNGGEATDDIPPGTIGEITGEYPGVPGLNEDFVEVTLDGGSPIVVNEKHLENL